MSIDQKNVEIRDAVERAGFYTKLLEPNELGRQIICVSHCIDGVYRGTSCWITCLHGQWILGSFGYRRWLIASEQDVTAIAIAWLQAGSGPGAPPLDLVQSYGLRELTDEEFDEFKKTTMIPDMKD